MKNYKKLGQHFLLNKKIIEEIINKIKPKNNQSFVEIGSGFGAITKEIIKYLNKITVIEIDKNVSKWIKNKKIYLIQKDVLKVNFFKIYNKLKSPLRIIGNLPYKISLKILFYLMKFFYLINDLHFMFQKEVADRITAEPGSKKYGKLTLIVKFYFKTKIIMNVSPINFFPKPKVYSSFVYFKPTRLNSLIYNYKKFLIVVKNAFSFKRKIIKNNLNNLFSDKQLIRCNIDPKIRAEKVNMKKYLLLSKML
ncbi:MAG: 16S rRNA (adenine(1518)-N(6)/adenine(1519)-N(6))-dimethyltransferase RsmA [Enterobacteriaceae bacterium]